MKEKICLFLRVFCMTTLFVVSVSCGLFTKNAFADDKIITGGPGTCTVYILSDKQNEKKSCREYHGILFSEFPISPFGPIHTIAVIFCIYAPRYIQNDCNFFLFMSRLNFIGFCREQRYQIPDT